MLKVLGAVLLVLAGAGAGYLQSHKLRRRKERLRTFLEFLSAARTEISYAALPVEEILERHGQGLDFLAPYFAARTAGAPFLQAWDKAVHSPLLTQEDRAVVSGFGDGFGASDTEGQMAHCGLYMDLTRKLLAGAEEDCARKCKLYQMLGICGGAVAALVII